MSVANDLEDFRVTEKGSIWIGAALRACKKYGLTWTEGLTSLDGTLFRDALGFDLSGVENPEDFWNLWGATAVVVTLVDAARGEISLSDAIDLLDGALLLSEKNVAHAAASMSISEKDMWSLLRG